MYTQEEYNAKRQARYERLTAAAERAASESAANWNTARQMASIIPFGQPILIGHYSEGRDRNYRARIESKHRKGYELHQKAEEYKSRAASVQDNSAIFSDDPSAVDQLTAKIEQAETLQETYKAVNAAYKSFLKKPASLDDANIPTEYKNAIRNFKPEWSGDKPIPAYRLTNNNANIRRMKERAEEVARKQATADTKETVNGIKFEYVPSENRIRITFPGRVSNEQFQALRQHGYRLAKSFSDYTFSAYHNNNAKYYAELVKGAK